MDQVNPARVLEIRIFDLMDEIEAKTGAKVWVLDESISEDLQKWLETDASQFYVRRRLGLRLVRKLARILRNLDQP